MLDGFGEAILAFHIDQPWFRPKRDTVRFSGLDALRGIAALGVALYHLGWYYTLNLDAHFASSLSFPFGHYGVDLCFCDQWLCDLHDAGAGDQRA